MLLRYIGGKSRLLPEIKKRIPTKTELFVDVFCGGFSVSQAMSHIRVISNDLSPVMKIYQAIKDDDLFINKLRDKIKEYNTAQDQKELYLQYRAEFNLTQCPVLLTIINRTCFNGVMRFNKKGSFNTPFGEIKKIREDLVEEAIKLKTILKDIELYSLDFECFLNKIENKITDKTIIYFDPPYETSNKSKTKNKYTSCTWQLDRLLKVLKDLDNKSIKWIVSNSYCDTTLEAFKNYNIEFVSRNCTISRDSSSRTKTKEIIVRNYN